MGTVAGVPDEVYTEFYRQLVYRVLLQRNALSQNFVDCKFNNSSVFVLKKLLCTESTTKSYQM